MKTPTQAEFRETWSETILKNTLPLSLVDDPPMSLPHTRTNLVLRQSLDAVLHHLLPWDIEMVIDEPEPEPEVCEKVLMFILFTQTYLVVVS